MYAAATNDYGTAVWNDTRNTQECPAIDLFRQALHDQAVGTGAPTAAAEEPRGEAPPTAITADPTDAPDVQQECPPAFGETDIYGGSYLDPTP